MLHNLCKKFQILLNQSWNSQLPKELQIIDSYMMYAATGISLCVFTLAANVVSQAQDTYPHAHVDEDG